LLDRQHERRPRITFNRGRQTAALKPDMSNDWSREEVEATVADYLAMLASELAGVPYNKTAHRRKLAELLDGRSEQAIEFKHANTSAVLIDLGFPYISGYKPRSNYQQLLYAAVSGRIAANPQLLNVAAADADQPIVVPEVDDILSVLTSPPVSTEPPRAVQQSEGRRSFSTNYLEREARNRSLGLAGEQFVLNFERARLLSLRKDDLAGRIEHTSSVRGDGEGYDILSYEESGRERLIEVKTTKYGRETPFFVSSNELAVSEAHADEYHLYRLFGFRLSPRLFTVSGTLQATCWLSASSYLATVR
jgi:hypothetical protein